MILADKIIDLRKKAGWSQEELAEKLAVTRQSVSKWEGAQSIPDMDKVVQMSRLFGVTTDYLLKDEIEIAEPTVTEDDRRPPLRRVTIGEASDYLALRRTAAPKMALATMLCIFSPIALIGLAAVSELSASAFPLREETAAGIGLCALLILVAIAVTLFLSCGNKAKEYEFLEKEPFETEYGVTGMVKERQKAFKPTYDHMNTIGTVLCVLSFVPLFAVMAVRQDGFFYDGSMLAAGGSGDRCVLLCVRRDHLRFDGEAAGGGRLYPQGEIPEEHYRAGERDLLAGGDGNFYDLYLWPQRQWPAPIQLDHLGGGRCAVCRGAGGNKADKEPEITALERKRPKGRFFAVLTGTACGKMKKACCNFAV